MRNNILSRNVPMYVLEVTFNLALLACIRQDKADVLEALLPQVEHIDNAMMATLIAITIIIMISIAIKKPHHLRDRLNQNILNHYFT